MDSEPGGGRSEGVGTFLNGGGTCGVAVWGGDVDPHPEDGGGPGQFPKQGRKEDHRDSAAATGGWELGIIVSGGGTGRSGFRRDKEVGHKEAEHGRTVYCDVTNSGPLREGHSAAGSEGVSSVAGTGRYRLGGGEKAGDGGKDGIGVGIGGRVGRGIERGLGRRGGVSGSEQVEWSGM